MSSKKMYVAFIACVVINTCLIFMDNVFAKTVLTSIETILSGFLLIYSVKQIKHKKNANAWCIISIMFTAVFVLAGILLISTVLAMM